MPPDETFRDWVLEQLQALGDLDCRRMFGSYGLYHAGVLFAIVCQGRLYFKTNAATRLVYQQHGMQPFQPNARQTLTSYYEVPLDILEDPAQLTAWAQEAVTCQTAGNPTRRAPRRARKR